MIDGQFSPISKTPHSKQTVRSKDIPALTHSVAIPFFYKDYYKRNSKYRPGSVFPDTHIIDSDSNEESSIRNPDAFVDSERKRSSVIEKIPETYFYKKFLPRDGANLVHHTQTNWEIFKIGLSVTYSYILKGPPRMEWSYLYTLAVLTTKKIFEQISSNGEPALLEYQRLHLSKATKVPIYAMITNEYFKTNQTAIDFFKRKSPGEWPEFAKNVGQIYGEFVGNKKSDQTSVILTFHGGMHVTGSAQVYRAFNYNLSKKSGSVVFAINYRLAPLNPYPCGLIDALSAYIFLIEEKGVNPNRIILSGDSAG